MKITTMVATATVGMLALVGCSSGGDGSDSTGRRDALVEAMVSEGATEEQANCFVDEVGVADTERIRAAQDSELSAADMATIEEALQKCAPELVGAGATVP